MKVETVTSRTGGKEGKEFRPGDSLVILNFPLNFRYSFFDFELLMQRFKVAIKRFRGIQKKFSAQLNTEQVE